jgi:hypothetical protein
VCGIILSSDKMHITNMCGGQAAHPLLISIANIKMSIRNKASSHAFLLLALLPIPQYLHPISRIRSILEARLIHHCLDIILEPLKVVARIGRMMSDPVGNLRLSYTPIISYILDTPEACMVACMHGLTSSVTMAQRNDFGDPERHLPRTASTTLDQLKSIECDPNNVEEYFATCEKFHLNGIAKPFWRDWPLAEPSQFLTPEPLHYWHREFWDHNVWWCKQALGNEELDFCFSVFPPITGLHHFHEGITKLKQVTGCAQ